MPVKHRRGIRWRRRRKAPQDRGILWKGMALMALLLCGSFVLQLVGYLRSLSSATAISDAEDLVVDTVNQAVIDMMVAGGYDYSYFVNIEQDQTGRVVSLDANMARINAFSAELLYRVTKLDEENIQVHIPLGNLMGSSILLGKGPDVVIEMIMLTSSYTKFRSELHAAGINQTEHRLLLDVVVDIDVLVPWGREQTQIITQVLIAETVIMGEVPNMYVNTGK